MRSNIIKSLFFTNALYMNPQMTIKYRKKYKYQDIRVKVFKNLLLISLLNIFVVASLFGIPFSSNINNGPMYLNAVIFIAVYSIVAVATAFLNMFYESKDTLAMLSLPISENELFFSKFLALLLQLSGSIIPFIIINFAVGLGAEFSLFKILFILVYTIAILIFFIGAIMIIASTMTFIPNFQKNKGKINGFLIVLGLLGIFIWITFSAISKNNYSNGTYSGDILLNTLKNPISDTYKTLLIIVVLSIIAVIGVYKIIVKNYLSTIHRISGIKNTPKKEKVRKTSTLRSKIIKRNLKLYSNGTLVANVFSNMILGIVILAGASLQMRKGDVNVELIYYPVAIFFGSTMSFLMISNPINFPGVAISLEKQDYYHLKSLPIDLRKYFKIKLTIAVLLQLTMALILFLSLLIFSKLNVILIIVASTSFIVTSLSLSINSFVKDYKKLSLNWNNIVELSTRGSNQLILALTMIGILFVLTIITIITGTIIDIFPNTSHIFGILYISLIFLFLIYNILKLKKEVFNKIK